MSSDKYMDYPQKYLKDNSAEDFIYSLKSLCMMRKEEFVLSEENKRYISSLRTKCENYEANFENEVCNYINQLKDNIKVTTIKSSLLTWIKSESLFKERMVDFLIVFCGELVITPHGFYDIVRNRYFRLNKEDIIGKGVSDIPNIIDIAKSKIHEGEAFLPEASNHAMQETIARIIVTDISNMILEDMKVIAEVKHTVDFEYTFIAMKAAVGNCIFEAIPEEPKEELQEEKVPSMEVIPEEPKEELQEEEVPSMEVIPEEPKEELPNEEAASMEIISEEPKEELPNEEADSMEVISEEPKEEMPIIEKEMSVGVTMADYNDMFAEIKGCVAQLSEMIGNVQLRMDAMERDFTSENELLRQKTVETESVFAENENLKRRIEELENELKITLNNSNKPQEIKIQKKCITCNVVYDNDEMLFCPECGQRLIK